MLQALSLYKIRYGPKKAFAKLTFVVWLSWKAKHKYILVWNLNKLARPGTTLDDLEDPCTTRTISKVQILTEIRRQKRSIAGIIRNEGAPPKRKLLIPAKPQLDQGSGSGWGTRHQGPENRPRHTELRTRDHGRQLRPVNKICVVER